MGGLEHGELFGIPLFQSVQQGCAKVFDVADHLFGPLQHEAVAIVGHRTIEIRQQTADVAVAVGESLHQGAHIQRWLEQGQLAEDALDIEAMANVEQATFYSIPKADEIGVFGDAEGGNDVAVLVQGDGAGAGGHVAVEIQCGEELGGLVKGFADALVVANLLKSARSTGFRPGTEQVKSQHIQQECLVDGLAGFLGKQRIPPVQQVVDVFHDDRFLVGIDPQTGDRMGVERIIAIFRQGFLIAEDGRQTCQVEIAEGQILPVAIGIHATIAPSL